MAGALTLNAFTPPQSTCRLCRHGSDAAGNQIPFFDRPIIETDQFRAIASLGSIVPGWILISPRIHLLNMAASYLNPDFVKLRTLLARILEDEFSLPVRIFEHGAARSGSRTGCGVDHAHLHMVPLSTSLGPPASTFQENLEWFPLSSSEVARFVGGQEYLFYSDDSLSRDPAGIVALVDEPISQFFRRVLADEVHLPTLFDYRTHSFDSNIRETHLRIESRLSIIDILEAATTI